MTPAPASLLIRDIHTLVTMDGRGTVLRGGCIYVRDGRIAGLGRRPRTGWKADRTLRAGKLLAVPGLINTHHHLYQTLTRALPRAANAGLFDWLRALYPLWARLDEEAVFLSSLVGMAELMFSGCTTTSDHHYVFPRGRHGLMEAQIQAARRIGMRFHACRGSMSLSEKDGGLPPDSVVEGEEEILADCERTIRKYHDPRPGAMLRVALAPCSPFSVTPRLMRSIAELAHREGVRLHTHLAETRDEEEYCRQRYGRRPLDFLADNGWLDENTWLAHAIYLNRSERKRLGRAGTGVAHCPTSNMRLGSGIAPVLDLRRCGCPVGLGVDGSASNDSSNLLAEARQSLLLQRVAHGPSAMTVMEALDMATRQGARCLGREDLGSLEPGQPADIAFFNLEALGYCGAGDPLSALLLCAPQPVDTLLINGRIVIEDGQLRTLALDPVLRRHRQVAQSICR